VIFHSKKILPKPVFGPTGKATKRGQPIFNGAGMVFLLLMEEIRLTSLIYGKHTIFYRVSYIPGGGLGFQPSTV